jgi:hypothetical protein
LSGEERLGGLLVGEEDHRKPFARDRPDALNPA